MRLSRVVWFGLLAGVLITSPVIALFYLAEQVVGLPFAPFDLLDWLTRNLPGDVITKGIDTMVGLIHDLNLGETSSTAKKLETFSALAAFFSGGVGAGAVLFALLEWAATRFDLRAQQHEVIRYAPGILGGLLVSLPVILISRNVNVTAETSDFTNTVWLSLVFGAWGAAITWLFFRLWQEPARAMSGTEPDRAISVEPVLAEQISRRNFLIRVGGVTATLTVIGAGLGRYLEYREAENYKKLIARRRAQAAAIAQELPNAGDPVLPAPGTRPELTPLEDHYRIDINVRPLELDAETWRLHITGLVDRPMDLTIDDLRDNYDPLHQYVTLACISNSVGGDLTSTIQWIGARLKDVLEEAGIKAAGRYALIRSADGFHETLDLALLEEDDRIMLCYSWEGIPLLHKHGFPLRIYIPDRYGMKQPKWITDIEISDQYAEGYWVKRGWDSVAQMRATAVVDVAASDMPFERAGQTFVPVGGIAHAGARGISKVEVQVDDGEWVETQLRSPLSETTWVIWRYDWPFEEGQHIFRVRCYEKDSTPQIETSSGSHPSGATGYDRMSQTF
ncbi:MAG: molybdopterin-dependent oxidoreductase [Chloroflexi bacterium]|nr:molybdopterin-dependent oxidoreductase [Chloroflexota bacterium]